MNERVQQLLLELANDREPADAVRRIWRSEDDAVEELMESLEQESLHDEQVKVPTPLPNEDDVFPEMVEPDGNDSLEEQAIERIETALVSLGDKAVAELCRRLASAARLFKERIVETLCAFSPIPAEAVPYFLVELDDPSPAERRHALRCICAVGIGRSGQVTEEIVYILCRIACDSNERQPLRTHCIEVLTELLHDFEEPEYECVPSVRVKADPRVQAALTGLVAALKDPDEKVRAQSTLALAEFGRDAWSAASALIETLTDPVKEIRGQAAVALGAIGADAGLAVPALVQALNDPDKAVVKNVLTALGQIAVGGAAELATAVMALIRAAGNSDVDVSLDAQFALLWIGNAAVPTLIHALKDPDDTVRQAAAASDCWCEADPEIALPALLEATKDPDSEVRRGAASALKNFDATGKVVGPALKKLLDDPDARVCEAAAFGLGKFPHEAKTLVPGLIEGLRNPEVAVRRRAANILGHIGGPAKSAAPMLAKALEDADESVRERAAFALGELGKKVAALAGSLSDPSKEVRRSAAHALAHVGDRARAAVPALIESLTDVDKSVRIAAACAILKLCVPAPEVVPVLLEMEHGELFWSSWPADVLCNICSTSPATVPDILRAVRRVMKDKLNGVSAARALGRIGAKVPIVMPIAVAELREALKNPDTARNAVVGLSEMAPGSGLAVQTLIQAVLTSPEQHARAEAATTLGKTRSKVAIPTLSGALQDSAAYVRMSAAEALGEIGADAKTAIPLIRQAMNDPVSDVRDAAANSFFKMGGGIVPELMEILSLHEAALRCLKSLLHDPDRDIRLFAGSAYDVIDGLVDLEEERVGYVAPVGDLQTACALVSQALEAVQVKAFDQGTGNLNEALRLTPDLPNAWFCRGKVHEERGAFAAARSDMARAIELDGNDPEWHFHLGRLLQGCPDTAVRDEALGEFHLTRAKALWDERGGPPFPWQ